MRILSISFIVKFFAHFESALTATGKMVTHCVLGYLIGVVTLFYYYSKVSWEDQRG
jgi:hypothetical protein